MSWKKLTITDVLFLFSASLGLNACGSFTSDQLLTVEMYGISKSPEGATGTRDPKFQTYQLLTVDVVSTDGTSTTNLFNGEEEKIFRIVDREQLIYSKQIAELEGNSYGSIQLTFDPNIEGGDSEDKPLSFTMSTPTLTLIQPFAIEKAKNITVIIKLNWGNTLSDEALTEPQYVLSIN